MSEQAEVDDDALTMAIEAVKVTVRASGRLWVDSVKVRASKAVEYVVGNSFKVYYFVMHDVCPMAASP